MFTSRNRGCGGKGGRRIHNYFQNKKLIASPKRQNVAQGGKAGHRPKTDTSASAFGGKKMSTKKEDWGMGVEWMIRKHRTDPRYHK